MKEVSLVEWSGLNYAAKQELLKSKDVLIYDPEAKATSFNEDALLRIMESMTSIFMVHNTFQRDIEVLALILLHRPFNFWFSETG